MTPQPNLLADPSIPRQRSRLAIEQATVNLGLRNATSRAHIDEAMVILSPCPSPGSAQGVRLSYSFLLTESI